MNITNLTHRKLLSIAGGLLIGLTSVSAQAGPLPLWSSDGWTAMTLDSHGGDGVVGPGGGGQAFDAEGLYYKLSGTTLSIGLQAGFDLIDGHVYTSPSPNDYYAGDLALSFDGSTSTYEYGVDFGLLTKDYQLDLVDMDTVSPDGIDAPGFYSATTWNTDVYSGHSVANPFALDAGTIVSTLSDNSSGSGFVSGSGLLGGTSYYRTVSFDIASLGLTGDIDLAAHWTMSCGNDYINGTTTISAVSEPSIISLMMLSMLMMGWTGRRRKQVA